MYSSCKTEWQSVFSTEVLLWDQRKEIVCIASLLLILTLKRHICNLSSFCSFMYGVTEFLEEQSRDFFFFQLTSKLSFHRLWRVCLCTFSLSTAMFAVEAILVDVESYELADGFSSCKFQDQLSGRLSEVGSWQPNGYSPCSIRNSTVHATG